MAIGWRCFTLDPCKENEKWVCEFYANLSAISFSELVNMIIQIGGKEVDFGDKKINDIYGLQNTSIGEFKEKGCKPENWLAERLCPGKEVCWVVTNKNISINDFTAKAHIWFNIIYSQVSSFTHMTTVPYLRAWMVA
ncbi:hypothetical protein FXO38_02276 [Capsicum annuum]|nr:hypothetical protein FXO38_02276 [Capsicum annuum]KAF3682710.1 hypothetical protein FXO37_02206 [Capsicum annuum]